MSSIDSIGSNLLQYMQQMRASDSTVQGAGNRPPPPQNGDVPEPLWEDVESTAESAGLSEEEIEDLRSELKTALSEALENLDASQSSDSRAAMDEAILSTLEDHGLDTSSIREKMSEAANRPAGPPPQGYGPPAGQSQGQGQGQTQGVSSLLSSITTSSTDTDKTSKLLSWLTPLIDEQA